MAKKEKKTLHQGKAHVQVIMINDLVSKSSPIQCPKHSAYKDRQLLPACHLPAPQAITRPLTASNEAQQCGKIIEEAPQFEVYQRSRCIVRPDSLDVKPQLLLESAGKDGQKLGRSKCNKTRLDLSGGNEIQDMKGEQDYCAAFQHSSSISGCLEKVLVHRLPRIASCIPFNLKHLQCWYIPQHYSSLSTLYDAIHIQFLFGCGDVSTTCAVAHHKQVTAA